MPPEPPRDQPRKVQLMDQEVAATGFGETIEEAKLDAIRNALSRSFDQFVFVERQIADDEIRRDVVISTMNGFVKDIELVSVTRDENGFYSIFASVTVSGSGLENFIAKYISVTELNLQRSKINGSEVSRLGKSEGTEPPRGDQAQDAVGYCVKTNGQDTGRLPRACHSGCHDESVV